MSRTRWVVFDDSHRDIVYEGSWSTREDTFAGLGTRGPTYRGSQHSTNGAASLSFPFVGSQLTVLGTSNVLNSSTSTDPYWECLVDGIPIPTQRPSPSHENNWPLCYTYNQTFARHTLTLNIPASEQTFLLDQIRYLPLANMTTVLQHASVIIEQSDPSIQYASGDWQATDDAMLALQAGSTVNVKFTGTKLTWVGQIVGGLPSDPSSGTYTLDSRSPVRFTWNGSSAITTTQLYQTFFETPDLDMGTHTLTVTHQGTSAPIVLDYLLVEDGDIIAAASGNPAPSSTAIIPGDTTAPASSSSGSKTPVGAIVGGVLGGIALIGIFVLAFFFLRKRTSARRDLNEKVSPYYSPDINGSRPSAPQPLYLPPSPPHAHVVAQNSFTSLPMAQSNTTGGSIPGQYPVLYRPDGSDNFGAAQPAAEGVQRLAPLRRTPGGSETSTMPLMTNMESSPASPPLNSTNFDDHRMSMGPTPTLYSGPVGPLVSHPTATYSPNYSPPPQGPTHPGYL